MKERPIMFKAEMVRAILDGRKTQTRRPVNIEKMCGKLETHASRGKWRMRDGLWSSSAGDWNVWSAPKPCPYGVPGDRLWVKETLQRFDRAPATIQYAATMSPMVANQNTESDAAGRALWLWGDRKKHSAMFMPRWASRITLEIVSVRVERVNEITDLGAQCEGVRSPLRMVGAHRAEFGRLWDTLYANTPSAWAANPWVWVVEFKRAEMPR